MIAKNEFNLVKKEQLTKTIWAFWFNGEQLPDWQAGQYMEWVLPHSNIDKRGTRRFFTIASSPTEKELMIATKVINPSSTFKVALRDINIGDPITAQDVNGDFILPKDRNAELVFIAGGIGITPFRSMLKWLLDTNQQQPITLLYANKTADEIAFKDFLDKTANFGWLKPIYFFSTKLSTYEVDSNGFRDGLIDENAIRKYVPDFQDKLFYVSGPEPVVEAMEKILKKIGIRGRQLKTDYFPGYSD